MKFYTEMVNDKNFNEELIEYAVIWDNKPIEDIGAFLDAVKELVHEQKSRLHALEGIDMKKGLLRFRAFASGTYFTQQAWTGSRKLRCCMP